jgi:hypothetical protein
MQRSCGALAESGSRLARQPEIAEGKVNGTFWLRLRVAALYRGR